jgi:hypothetical protein
MADLYNYKVAFEKEDGKVRCYRNDNSMPYRECYKAFAEALCRVNSNGYVLTSANIIRVV